MREEAPILDFSSSKAIFKSEKGGSEQKLADIRAKLNGLIDTESWEWEDVLEVDATTAQAVDCIIYYGSGFLGRMLRSALSCIVCRQSLTAPSSVAPEAALTNPKTRGGLTYPNFKLFTLLKTAEDYFSKHGEGADLFWDTIEHIT